MGNKHKQFRMFWLAGSLVASVVATVWLASATELIKSQTELLQAKPVPATIETDKDVVAASQPSRYLGALSCSSTACHGSVLPHRQLERDALKSPVLRNEYIVWLEQDPHSRAGAVLHDQRSKQMLQALGALTENGGQLVTTERYDVTMRHCAGCHNPAGSFRAHDWLDAYQREPREIEGVTCEACHGASADYLTPHYMPGWPRGDEVKKVSEFGMLNTEPLLPRARICARCHVGAPGMDVNHDLIAAGHPALRFEFSSYLELLPKHWNEQQEKMRLRDFETRAWFAGQIACVEAALDLLVHRTADIEATNSRFGEPAHPELSEYDCFSCHHDLRASSWRGVDSKSNSTVGRLLWGSWYFSLTKEVIGKKDTGFASALDALQDSMCNLSTPRGDVHLQAMAARRQLARWILDERLEDAFSDHSAGGHWSISKSRLIDSLSATLAADDGRQSVRNWEVAVQYYLLLAALDVAQRDEDEISNRPITEGATRTQELRAVRRLLAFPVHYDSPRTFVSETDLDDAKGEPIRDNIRSRFILIDAALHN